MSPPVLDTARLRLLPLAEDDRALYTALYGSAEVMQHIGAPLDAEALARSFARALRHNDEEPWRRRFWSMRERDGDQPIGLLALSRVESLVATGIESGNQPDEPQGPQTHPVLAATATAEIGAMLLPAHQARGYAAEAISRLVEHAFEDASIDELITRHVVANPLATGLMRKLGFVPETHGESRLWRRAAPTRPL